MNTKQHNKLAMYLAVKGVLDANNSVWQPLQAFADGYTDFSQHVQNIQILGQSRMTGTSGIALDKKASKLAMGTAALEIASAVHAFAVKNKNNTLATETDFTLSDLTAERDADAVKDCQNVHDLANANLTVLGNYGVGLPKLAALQAAIDAFSAIVSKPRDNIASGKTATQQMSDEFDAADSALEEGLDRLIRQFQNANAKFVSDYNNARTIVDTTANPESADAVIARDSDIFVADKLSDLNKQQLDGLKVMWVELRNTEGYRRFSKILDELSIPHNPYKGDVSKALDKIFQKIFQGKDNSPPEYVAKEEKSSEFLVELE